MRQNLGLTGLLCEIATVSSLSYEPRIIRIGTRVENDDQKISSPLPSPTSSLQKPEIFFVRRVSTRNVLRMMM